MKKLMVLMVLVMMVSGCATVAVQKGMTKDQVQAVWGQPDAIKTAKNSCQRGADEEAWHFFGSPYRDGKQDKSVLFRGEKVVYAFEGL